jgi:serine/threonine-protein kinase
VLDAMSYAHDKGVLHRDLKPSNIMIGPYGEVTVMDWGIAKPLGGDDERLLETRNGSLAGTPLYMSPEQAFGMNSQLDERSDVYSLSVVLYEWLVLEHPLGNVQSVAEVLASFALREHSAAGLAARAQAAGAPMEYVWIVYRGMKRDRDERYQSVKELESAIKGVLDGKIKVECHFTLAKSYAHRLVHWIDRHPKLYTVLFRTAKFLLLTAALAVVTAGVWSLTWTR